MKRLRKVFIAVMLVLPFLLIGSNASAYIIEDGWTIDLSGVHSGLGNHIDIDRVIVSGQATIIQSYGGNTTLDNGDTFTELSWLQTLTYWIEPGVPGNLQNFDLTDDNNITYNLYLYATGLTGSVYNVTGTGPADWEFKYKFDPGVGTMGIYLDRDADPLNGFDKTLTNLGVIFPSGGDGPGGFLGGVGVNGTTDMTALFSNTLTGVFKTSSGLDYGSLPPNYFGLGLLNTSNVIDKDNITFAPDGSGFTALIDSAGKFEIATVPEPATMLLLGSGLLGLAVLGRKKNFFKKD